MNAIFESHLIPNLEQSAHCSTIIELPNNMLMVSFYAGTAEAALDSKVYLSIYDSKKEGWQKPLVVLDTPNHSNGNAVLFRNRRDRIYLFNNTIHREWRKFPRLWNWALTDNKVMFSDDFGKSWSENKPLFPNIIGWNFRNKPIYLTDGSVLFSMYDDLYFRSYILISRDHGENWEISNPIETDPQVYGIKQNFYKLIDKLIPLFGNIQPSLIEKENGSVMAFLRPKNFKRVLISRSTDGGLTWSKTKKTRIKNPQSGIDAVKLKNGKILLVFNNSEENRSVLNVALSDDEARTWKHVKRLEQENKQEFSYPAVIQDSQDFIHITYTYKRECIKHIKLNEEWITS